MDAHIDDGDKSFYDVLAPLVALMTSAELRATLKNTEILDRTSILTRLVASVNDQSHNDWIMHITGASSADRVTRFAGNIKIINGSPYCTGSPLGSAKNQQQLLDRIARLVEALETIVNNPPLPYSRP